MLHPDQRDIDQVHHNLLQRGHHIPCLAGLRDQSLLGIESLIASVNGPLSILLHTVTITAQTINMGDSIDLVICLGTLSVIVENDRQVIVVGVGLQKNDLYRLIETAANRDGDLLKAREIPGITTMADL